MKRQFSPCYSMCGTIIRCCMLLMQLGMQSDNCQAIRFFFLRFVRKVAFARVSSVVVKNHDGGSSLVALLLALMCMSGRVDALSFELDLPVLVLGLDALTLLWHICRAVCFPRLIGARAMHVTATSRARLLFLYCLGFLFVI